MRGAGLAMVGALLVAGCAKEQPEPDKPGEPPKAAAVWPGAPAAAPKVAEAGAGVPVLVPEAERGETGARNLLLEFARAVELKRFAAAHALLGEAGKRWSAAGFARVFDGMGKITVAVGNGAMEGAAGSSYYAVPIAVTADDRAGRPLRLDGQAVVRRVNDVNGATAAQLRWHFQTLTLDWTH